MEPWTIVSCTKCNHRYHLADGPKCECGKQEWKELFKLYLGEENGFAK